VNGRELVTAYGLLRNSTIFATQKFGLEQCSGVPDQQKAPVSADTLKQRPKCSHSLPCRKTSFLPLISASLKQKRRLWAPL
jgi:hypothetical protein